MMPVFRIPYYMPEAGMIDPLPKAASNGHAGSHPREQITQPRIYPIVYNVGAYGLGNMPRFNMGLTKPIVANNYSYPTSISNLQIAGLYKK
jgi:hypothetical protein